ncbi:MAG: hypothetical protein FWF97_04085 [Alphaproteobacteria bacterium]|nr:hypothetical protein [Alphaproteobacteria bacterium]
MNKIAFVRQLGGQVLLFDALGREYARVCGELINYGSDFVLVDNGGGGYQLYDSDGRWLRPVQK